MQTEFQKKVYEEVKKIKKGEIKTYKQIARKLKTSPRAVGQALAKNTNKSVPCHRVIMSSGEIGGYKGNKNNKKKIQLLRKEGIEIKKISGYNKLKN